MSHKKDFPLLKSNNLVYLDSGATAHKPQCVIDSISDFYTRKNANVHRGIYRLSEEATSEYEGAREKIRKFINAESVKEVIFTSGTTESINTIATSFASARNNKVLISSAEHHANIVPYQINNCKISVVGYDSGFRFDMDDYKKKLADGVGLVAIVHASNVLGTINPIKEIVKLAHEAGAKVLVDGAQAVPHIPVDVRDLDVDFYAFSGHKVMGPTGIGVLYAKKDLLDKLEPARGGGDMVRQVSFEKSEWNDLPWKFEAGTPNIAGAIGLGRAVEYLLDVTYDSLIEHENELGSYALERLGRVDGLKIYGPQTMKDRISVFSFVLDKIHAHDLASVLDEQNIAIRAGHHCCMPLHETVIKQSATARASLYLYNSKEDVDALVEGLEKAITIFR